MAEFLLIHGSGFGAWCWRDLIPALAAFGHNARAIDLPRRTYTDATLEDQARAICDSLTTSSILVGHSAGGFPITAAAENDPTKIRALVWLCAYIPTDSSKDGSSVASLRRSQREQPLRPALCVDRGAGRYSFAAESLDGLFFHDCPSGARAHAASLMEPEAIAPQETALPLTERSQSLPRFAIICDEDRAIPPAFQREMAATLPAENRFSLRCGHAPFFAKPRLTAEILNQIASLVS